MVGVEQSAEVRRLHFVRRLSIREIHRRTGLHRETVRRALRSDKPPRYERARRGSKLDPFKDEIHRLLAKDPKLPGVVVRERLEGLGFAGSKTELTVARRRASGWTRSPLSLAGCVLLAAASDASPATADPRAHGLLELPR